MSGKSVREKFYSARGAGWYELRVDDVDLVFNRRGGPSVPMNRLVWCQAPRQHQTDVIPIEMVR